MTKELIRIGKTQLPMTKLEWRNYEETRERRRHDAKESIPEGQMTERMNRKIFENKEGV